MPQDGFKDHLGDFLGCGGSDLQDARGWSRMPQDGVKDHPGDFSWMRLQELSSRMLEDGSRMPQDGFKDHPGDFSWMRRE